MNYLDLFSGAGGFHLGLEEAGFEFDKVYYSEIDKYAKETYRRHFPEAVDLGDISAIDPDELPDIDIITFGWPCQDNSIAGKRKGQVGGTRSGLLAEAVRLIRAKRPRYFIAENVKGLLSVNRGVDFINTIELLTYLGEDSPQYTVEMQLCNTRWVLPQNRERTFFVGHLGTDPSGQIFPIEEGSVGTLERSTNSPVVRTLTAGGNSGGHHSGMTIIEDFYPDRLRAYEEESSTLRSDRFGLKVMESKNKGLLQIGNIDTKGHNSIWGRVYDTDGDASTLNSQGGGMAAKTGLYAVPVLTPDRLNKRQNGRRFKEDGEPSFTMTAQDRHGVATETGIRRLTPLECERLQGFPDNWTKYSIELTKTVVTKVGGIATETYTKEMSDSQRYKQMGNAVTVDMIKLIGRRLLNVL